MVKRGWFGESRRHSLASRGIKTTRFRYDMRFRDTDRDGVPDKHDCQPHNPKKQGLVHEGKVHVARLGWWSGMMATPPTSLLSNKKWEKQLSKFPYSQDRDKDGVPDYFDGDVRVKKPKNI